MFAITVIVITLTLQVIGSIEAENIALKKTITFTYSSSRAPFMNDGDKTDTCIWTNPIENSIMAIDLGGVFSIEKVVTYRRFYWIKQKFSIYVGDSYRPCYANEDLKNFRPCKLDAEPSAKETELKCDGSCNNGRFVALVFGDRDNSSSVKYNFDMCEIEIFGKFMRSAISDQLKPFKDKALTEIGIKNYDITREIVQNKEKMTVPNYSSVVVGATQNCQPIIWVDEKVQSFGQACLSDDGKSRLAVFGKRGYFGELIKEDGNNNFGDRLKRWLSPKTKNPAIVSTNKMKTFQELIAAVKKGDIVDFDVNVEYEAEFSGGLMSLVQAGMVAVSISYHDWGSTDDNTRQNMLTVLSYFSVDVVYSFITWSSARELKLDYDNLDGRYFGFKELLERIESSHETLIKESDLLSKKMKNMPSHILKVQDFQPIIKKILKKYEKYLIKNMPCKADSVKGETDMKILRILGEFGTYQPMKNSGYKMPGSDIFPGDFAEQPDRSKFSLELVGRTDNTKNPTGLYLGPGDTLSYKVKRSSGAWSVSIGCHTDRLPASKSELYRYPYIHVRDVPLGAAGSSGQVYSAYGGVLWLTNGKTGDSLDIEIDNVVRSPFFNLRDAQMSQKWMGGERDKPGLWAQIAGDSMVFCVESRLIRGYSGDYLNQLMAGHWDKLVKMDFTLKNVDWQIRRPEITVLDVQISMGSGHSGYPICAYPDWFNDMFDLDGIKTKGSWGMCHEVGHNMQEGRWTFSGLGEVTNNLMCLFNYDKLWKLPYLGSTVASLDDRGLTKAVTNHLKDSSPTFDSWKSNPFLTLMVYAQFANHMGWGFYHYVFKHYAENNINPKSDNDKINTWMNITSTVSGQNLLPLFEFWGLPIDKDLKKDLSRLPCFFPNDFFTEIGSSAARKVRSIYKNCNEKSKYSENLTLPSSLNNKRENGFKISE